MTFTTYADMLRPAARKQALIYDVTLVLGGSVLIGLSACIRIPLPFSPVPITGQTLTVLLMGALLGSRRGSLCTLAYLMQGAAGLPVFQGGHSGIAYLAGPTGGYLVGFVAAATITGLLAERGWDRKPGTTFLAMLAGSGMLYLFGLSWLALAIGSQNALMAGLVPFIPGDLLKIALATALLPAGWKLLGNRS